MLLLALVNKTSAATNKAAEPDGGYSGGKTTEQHGIGVSAEGVDAHPIAPSNVSRDGGRTGWYRNACANETVVSDVRDEQQVFWQNGVALRASYH